MKKALKSEPSGPHVSLSFSQHFAIPATAARVWRVEFSPQVLSSSRGLGHVLGYDLPTAVHANTHTVSATRSLVQ